MRQRPHSTCWPESCQSSWSRVSEAQPTLHGPAAARLGHPVTPGPVITAENYWAQAGQQPGTCFCAAHRDNNPGRPGAAPAECSCGWQLGSQMCSRYSAVHKLRRGLVTLSVRYFSEYTVIFSLCVCIHMNMMVSFHYNKNLFPKYFFYNIHVETMSLTWRRHLSHEHLCV